jgi:hypothetical protein
MEHITQRSNPHFPVKKQVGGWLNHANLYEIRYKSNINPLNIHQNPYKIH